MKGPIGGPARVCFLFFGVLALQMISTCGVANAESAYCDPTCQAAIRQTGTQYLKGITSQDPRVTQLRERLHNYVFSAKKDDPFAWLCCVLALKAVNNGNYGIGAVIVDSRGALVTDGHNMLVNPYFRSDRHAEMVVLTDFEDNHKNGRKSGLKLFTSLEPCPMCYARILTSKMPEVCYVAADELGGMVHKAADMPQVWREMAATRTFRKGENSDFLQNLSFEIFLLNARELDDMLKKL